MDDVPGGRPARLGGRDGRPALPGRRRRGLRRAGPGRPRLHEHPALCRGDVGIRRRPLGLVGGPASLPQHAGRDGRRPRGPAGHDRPGRRGGRLDAGLQRILRLHRGLRAARGHRSPDARWQARRGGPGPRLRRGDGRGAAGGIPAVQPAEPDGHRPHPAGARGARRRSPRRTACRWSATRSTPRSSSTSAVHAVPLRARGRAGRRRPVGEQGVEPRGTQVRPPPRGEGAGEVVKAIPEVATHGASTSPRSPMRRRSRAVATGSTSCAGSCGPTAPR